MYLIYIYIYVYVVSYGENLKRVAGEGVYGEGIRSIIRNASVVCDGYKIVGYRRPLPDQP